MQSNGIRSNQVTQVRGFADQRLRKLDNPLDPANRRIALIVQYVVKNNDDDAKPAAANPEKKPRENSDGPTENSAKKQ